MERVNCNVAQRDDSAAGADLEGESQVGAASVHRVQSGRLRKVDVPNGGWTEGSKCYVDRLAFTHAGLQSHSATMAIWGSLAAPYHPFLSGNAHIWISTFGRMAALPYPSLEPH